MDNQLVKSALVNYRENLYIGHVFEASGSIQVGKDKRSAKFQGEVLLYGRIKDGHFVAERVGRLALYGPLEKPGPRDRIGILSLSGPLEKAAVITDAPGSGSIQNLHLQLYYRTLSIPSRNAQFRTKDTVFPEVEEIAVNLVWKQVGQSDGPNISLNIEMQTLEIIKRHPKGIVKAVSLQPLQLEFRRAGGKSPRGEPRNSLQSGCSKPTTPCSQTNPQRAESTTCLLAVKFINLAKNPNALDIEAICSKQISNTCALWRNKAALDLVVWEDKVEEVLNLSNNSVTTTRVDEGSNPEKDEFCFCRAKVKIAKLGNDKVKIAHKYIPIYVVDELESSEHTGGGITKFPGQPTAYCILQLDVADINPFLLAHELGHVLGLPDSIGTIMEPSPKSGQPNPHPKITKNECDFLSTLVSKPPLNSIIVTTGWDDEFCPDV